MVKKNAVKSTDQTLAEVDVAQIDERAVLVYLGTGAWTASKKDRDLTNKIIEEAQAAPGSLRAMKSLMPGAEELETIKKIVSNFRSFHYQKTTAFGRDGWALLPSKTLGEYKRMFTEAKDLWDEAVDVFISRYDALREEARANLTGLGKVFRETDYPSAEEVRARFRFTNAVRRIRESQNDLLGVSDDVRQEIMADADARVREGLEVSVTALAERISKTVSNVSEVLGRQGAKAPKVYDSLIDNVRALAEEIPALNVTGSEAFSKIADDMLTKLGSFQVEDLKGTKPEAKVKRAQAVATAEEIKADLDGIF